VNEVAAHLTLMTVQIDIEETLVSKIDALVGSLRINRTQYLKKLVEEDLVARQYAEAYGKQPLTEEEMEWFEIQHWEDE
jgi:hypothetical protein